MNGPGCDMVMLIDLDACIRCHACEVACREEQSLSCENTVFWCSIHTVGPRRLSGEMHMDFVPLICFHCENPLCGLVCPASAIAKDGEGLVRIDGEACTGCGLCVYACPYGRMFLDGAGKAGHCDLCSERVKAGLEPSCVKHCIGGALQFLPKEEAMEGTSGQNRLLVGKVCYISSTWKLNNPLPARA